MRCRYCISLLVVLSNTALRSSRGYWRVESFLGVVGMVLRLNNNDLSVIHRRQVWLQVLCAGAWSSSSLCGVGFDAVCLAARRGDRWRGATLGASGVVCTNGGTIPGTKSDRGTVTLGDGDTLGDDGVIGLGDDLLVGRRGEGGTFATDGYATINPVSVTLGRRQVERRAGKFVDLLSTVIGTVLSVCDARRA